MAISTYLGVELNQGDWPQPGDKMRYLGENGLEYQREHADQIIGPGTILTVVECYVGSFSSKIVFEEFPGEWNSVMFEKVAE